MSKRISAPLMWAATSLLSLSMLSACGGSKGSFAQPSIEPTVIEESDGGCDVLSQEFGIECDQEALSAERRDYVGINTPESRSSQQRQNSVESQFPHLYSSLNQDFPLRGSWRQTKAEVLDLVDRWVWSPEEGKPVELMKYFDMVLLVNIHPRYDSTEENSSAQRMQVYVRKNSSNKLQDWDRIHVWPISSGLPGGQKIATFTGVYKFNPNRFYPDYYSAQFEQANMYETMFLYHQYQYQSGDQQTGVAIHGTYKYNKLGRRDSGGCIRISRENSTCLFNTLVGNQSERCLNGGKLEYWGKVPSLLPRNGEADPEYLSVGQLEVGGYKVLIAIINDGTDKI